MSGDEERSGSATVPFEDYAALRHGLGAVALARDVLRVAGPDALSFLQGQLSQDLEPLVVGDAVDALLLTPQGKLDALVRVGRLADEVFTVDVAGGWGEAVAVRLARFKLRVKADIDPLPWTCLAVRGPEATVPSDATLATDAGVPADAGRGVTYAFSWNGVAGFDVLGEDPVAPSGVRVCAPGAWQAVRVESGIPAMGAELDERTIAAEADLLDRTVSFTKGCYTGQELVARLDARGNKVTRHLRGLVLADGALAQTDIGLDPTSDASWPDAGPLVGAPVSFEGRDVGAVTSASWSPALGRVVAMAYVHRSVGVPASVEVRASPHVLGAELRTLPLV